MPKWKTHSVCHISRLDGPRGHLPKLFDSNRPYLWIFSIHEIMTLNEFFCQIPSSAFPKDNNFCMNFCSGFILGFLLTVFVNPPVPCPDTNYLVSFIKKLRSRKTTENINALILTFFSQPACQFAEGTYITAMMTHGRRNKRE